MLLVQPHIKCTFVCIHCMALQEGCSIIGIQYIRRLFVSIRVHTVYMRVVFVSIRVDTVYMRVVFVSIRVHT